MIAMNARAELQGVAFDVIARDFLAGPAAGGAAGGARGFAAKLFGPDLGRLTRQHLLLVAVSVGLRDPDRGAAGRSLVFPHLRLRAPGARRSPACCRPFPRSRCWRC